MTEFEKAFKNMTPTQRKKATAAVSDMMGMPTKKRRKSSTTKKSGKK